MAEPRRAALGFDLGGTHLAGAVVTAGGRMVVRETVPTPPGGGRAIAGALAQLAHRLIRAAENKYRLTGLGLGTPGLVRDGKIAGGSFNLPGWHGFPVQKYLERETGLRFAGDNDVNAATLGEWRFGGGRGMNDFILLTLGTGLGGGVVAGGKLLRGNHGCAAELGHLKFDPRGRRCTCGGRGCVEAWLGAAGIVRTWREHGGRGPVTVADIFVRARRGERAGTTAVAVTADVLGHLLGNLITTFDPEAIFIGGGIAASARQFLPRAAKVARLIGWRDALPGLTIAPAHPDAGLTGAAALVLERRFH